MRVQVALAIAVGLAGGRARADDDDEPTRERARAHAELAKAAFARGDFAIAHDEFARAFDLAPIPDLIYDLALCEERLGRFADAAHSFERYLAAVPTAGERGELLPHIARLRAQAALDAAPTGAPLEASPRRPAWRRAWFWAVIGSVALLAAGAVTLAVLLAPRSPHLDYPAVSF